MHVGIQDCMYFLNEYSTKETKEKEDLIKVCIKDPLSPHTMRYLLRWHVELQYGTKANIYPAADAIMFP